MIPPQRRVLIFPGGRISSSGDIAPALTGLGIDSRTDADVAKLNSEMLDFLGLPPTDNPRLTPAGLDKLRATFSERACELVQRTSERTGVPVFEGPGIDVLLPFWLEIFSHSGFEPGFLLQLRDPQQTITSVSEGGDAPAHRSEERWASDVLAYLVSNDSHPRLFMADPNLAPDPAGKLARLEAFVGKPVQTDSPGSPDQETSSDRFAALEKKSLAIKETELRLAEFLKSLAQLMGEDPSLVAKGWKCRPETLLADLKDLLQERDAEIDSLTKALESFEHWQRSWFRRATGRWHRFPEESRTPRLRRLLKAATGDVAATAQDAPATIAAAGREEGSRDRLSSDPDEPVESTHEWLRRHWSSLHPLSTFPAEGKSLRLSIVTDSVDSFSLFGGVGTALILGALTANRMGARLRLVTRTSAPDAGALSAILSANRITLETEFELAHAPVSGEAELPVTPMDRFLTTSWWTTECLLPQIPQHHLAHLLQEDERMFYAYGDWRRRCHNVLNTSGLRLVVNSRLLYDALGSGSEPLEDFAARADWFEPAFPGSTPAGKPANEPRKLFFYARPNHSRNLFALGLEALTRACENGILAAGAWEVYFVGSHIPALTLPGAVRVQRLERLGWKSYQDVVAGVDAGFVLMDTPHPSYPPLDLAAAGAAVLTCRHGNKTDLSFYSRNLLTAEATISSLVAGLEALVTAANDDAQRAWNVKTDRIPRDWNLTLSGVVESLARHYSAVPHR